MKALLSLPVLALVLACGHDHEDGDHSHDTNGHTSPYASCQAIIDACHPKDTGEGAAHDCHDRAHAPTASEAACAAEKTTCTATCSAAPDAGAS